jgi:hypothetical protein
MSWLAVRVAGASPTKRDAISAALIDAGAACVQEDRDDLITYLPGYALLEGVRGAVAADTGAVLHLREAFETEITHQWPSTVGISRAGRLVVAATAPRTPSRSA